MVEIRQGSKQHYNTILYGPTRCKRHKAYNGRIYYETKFPRQTFYIFNNKFYETTLKEFKTIWKKKYKITDKDKIFKKKYRTLNSIPKYSMYKQVKGEGYFDYKVSNIFSRTDRYDKPYYWIQKTVFHPWKTDTRHKITRDYYIFYDGINKNGTIKNNAILWYPDNPWKFNA